MSTVANSHVVPELTKIEFCPNCQREWPKRFGDHNCGYHRLSVHRDSIIVEPGAELLNSVHRLASRLQSEARRSAEYAELAGEATPHRSIIADIDSTIGYLKRFRAEMQALASHEHHWDENDYCSICHRDGRA